MRAEEQLAASGATAGDLNRWAASAMTEARRVVVEDDGSMEYAAYLVARAQVWATLAVAVATANAGRRVAGGGA